MRISKYILPLKRGSEKA